MTDTVDNPATAPAALESRLEACRQRLRQARRVVVAFSAGVDSTFLLALAVQTLGRDNVLAAVGVSPSLPQRERASARELTERIGADLVEVQTLELDDPTYASNPKTRCYWCKKELFTRLGELAAERGFGAVVCGANADDQGDFRPGLKAGADLGVAAPLLESGLTKADIRAASQAMDLPTWDKPAMACLASRFPYGREITAEGLSRVERAEYALKDLGFRECRVRDHLPVARVEVPAADLPRVVELRQDVLTALKPLGYQYVALDLEGFRSGSMNEVLDPQSRRLDPEVRR